MIKWKKKGYSSLIKLAGDPKLFEKSWPKIISDITKKKNLIF